MNLIKKIFLSIIAISFLFVIFNNCEKSKMKGTKRFLVYTTFYPMYEFTKDIGGKYVEVIMPLPEGEDPAFWVPSRSVLYKFQNEADIIVVNGNNFEKFLKRVELPQDKLVITGSIFSTNELFRFHFVHSHGKLGKHSHIGINGHTWVSPIMAKQQSKVILDAFIKKDPLHKNEYIKNFNKLSKKFDELSALIKDALKNYNGEYIIVNHPAYDYLAKDFGFKIKDFGVHPDTIPDNKTFKKIVDFAKKHNSKYMLWEDMPVKEVRKYYEEKAGLKPIIFSPCENPSKGELKNNDYFSLMKKNIKNLKKLIDNL